MNTEYVMSSIATTSLKEILKEQNNNGKMIWSLNASSVDEHCPIDEELSIPMLGINAYLGEKTRFKMSYNHEAKNKRTGLQHNALTLREMEKIEKILKLLHIEDVSISGLTILFKSFGLTEILKKYCNCNWIKNNEENYIARFASEACDGHLDRKKMEKFERNTILIKNHRFKHYILNLKYLIDYSQYVSIPYPRRRPIVDCNKNRYMETINPYILSKTLKEIWGEYGITKQFKMDKENALVLVKVT